MSEVTATGKRDYIPGVRVRVYLYILEAHF